MHNTLSLYAPGLLIIYLRFIYRRKLPGLVDKIYLVNINKHNGNPLTFCLRAIVKQQKIGNIIFSKSYRMISPI